MTFKENAEKLIQKGLFVFPVVDGEKVPAVKEWQEWATNDCDKFKEAGNWQANVGVFTGKFIDGSLLVIDIDNKKGKSGDETITQLALDGFEFPHTYTVETPNAGRHLYYSVKDPVISGVNVLGPGVDVRSSGGFVVGAGSQVDGRSYVGNNAPIELAPIWLVERCTSARSKRIRSDHKKLEGIDQKSAQGRAIFYLENEAPLAIEGNGGDATTFKVLCRVKDFGVEEEQAIEILLNHWNERCEPPWSSEELTQKVGNAYRYGSEPIGAANPQAEFSVIETEEGENSNESGVQVDGQGDTPGKEERKANGEKSYLEKMNEEFALLFDERDHCIIQEYIDGSDCLKRKFISEQSFKRLFSPFLVQQPGSKRAKSMAEIWLDWKGRREYKGLCFSPEKDPPKGYYNLWTGWAVNPISPEDATERARRGLSMFLEHALNNVCGGNQELYVWLIGYFAHMIQKPYERPLTTLVFRGEKGVGKNALIDRVGKLLGPKQYLVAHDGRYLTSNFNGHLDSCLCLVLDEAFWSGDKAAEGKLKGITTAPTILIERKGREPYSVDNLVRLVVIGNEDWLVPASADERRYAVFDVGSGRKQDNEFFYQMRMDMEQHGGAGLLLHYLKNFDLSDIDINRAPVTAALLDQKVQSLDIFHEWWMACLKDGEVIGLDFGEGWPERVDKSQFRTAFAKYQKIDRNSRGWVHSDVTLGKLLKKVLPELRSGQKRQEDGPHLRQYCFPSLEVARKSFETFMGQKINWSSDEL